MWYLSTFIQVWYIIAMLYFCEKSGYSVGSNTIQGELTIIISNSVIVKCFSSFSNLLLLLLIQWLASICVKLLWLLILLIFFPSQSNMLAFSMGRVSAVKLCLILIRSVSKQQIIQPAMTLSDKTNLLITKDECSNFKYYILIWKQRKYGSETFAQIVHVTCFSCLHTG